VFCAPDTKLGPRRGCTPRTKACFTKKVVKKKQNKTKARIAREEKNAIPYAAFTLITVGKRLVRRRERGRGRKILRRRHGETRATRMCETETASQCKAESSNQNPPTFFLPSSHYYSVSISGEKTFS
jgi:hypothetical protein